VGTVTAAERLALLRLYDAFKIQDGAGKGGGELGFARAISPFGNEWLV
jgi:hypothetical protein